MTGEVKRSASKKVSITIMNLHSFDLLNYANSMFMICEYLYMYSSTVGTISPLTDGIFSIISKHILEILSE